MTKIKNKFTKIQKRDGRIVDFEQKKITDAIFKALTVTNKGGRRIASRLSNKAVSLLNKRHKKDHIPHVEEIQDIVEEILILGGYTETARSYILYREQHRKIRELEAATKESLDMISNYIDEIDWQVQENSNMTYSLQGLHDYTSSIVTKRYWLNKVYPKEIREAAQSGDFHIHDLGYLAPYCCGWDLTDLLIKGFRGAGGKVETAPAKHFRVALGHIVNFFYTLQGETAGAEAFSNFDTLLAPFIRYDDLNYKEVKQSMQEFIYNCNVPTRVGFQTPFSNLTMDLVVPENLRNTPIIIGGKHQKETYKEFQKEMGMLNQAFAEVMCEGDASGRVFTFPIPTYNITKDFDWDSPILKPVWEMTAKYGIPYFANFINSEMKSEDSRSMCPLDGNEKVLTKSTRGRGLEYSSIKNIYWGNSKNQEYEIYSHGKFVKGKFNKFPNQEMIKVILDNNHEIKMSKEHLNFILKNEKSKIEILKGRELEKGMYLPYSLKKYKGSGGNEDLGYFVGTFAGDGSFDRDTSVVFSLENRRKKEVIAKLKNISKKYFGANIFEKQDSKTKLYTLKIHSRAAVGLCKDFVIGVRREKHYREKLFGMSIGFRRGVLKGHYDTDGGNRHRIYTSSSRMVETLNMLAATMGTTTSVYKDSRKERLGKEPNYAVLIYQLNRKRYGKIWFKKGDKLWVRIKQIQNIGKSMAYCFEVKNDEPLFTVAASGILTHNCRLRLDNRELYKRGGGLFGSNPLTGSIGVVTINMSRIGFLSKTKEEFFSRLGHLMDLAKESLEIKRKTIEIFTEKSLYPYAKFYLDGVKKMRGSYWGNHFSTIGLIGMNEALLNFMKKDIVSSEGRKFTEEILDYMRRRMVLYQGETNNMYNLEATPGEGTAYRLARMDKQEYPDIITAGDIEPYYTNSTQLPVDYSDDLFRVLKIQDKIQIKYTGGCIEKGNKALSDKGLLNIEYIVENFKKLRPIKVLSYNRESEISEWDEIVEAVTIDVKKHDKIRIKGERNLDITTSDWHPFFVLERFKPNPTCPVCEEKIKDIKAFAAHIKWNQQCREIYQDFPKYRAVEKRADELKVGDYILQNSHNLYREKSSELNKDLMWMIGFYIGDGCISKFIDNRGGNNLKRYKIRFFSEHQRALDKMVKILNEYFYCEVKVIRNEKRSRLLKEISTSKKEVSEFFFKYGFQSGEKSYKIFVPQKIKENLTKTNVFSFLAGLMDSDGHISKRDGDFEYYTVSPRLADDILEICNITGIMLSKSLKKAKRKNEVDVWRLRIPQYELTKIKEKLNPTVNYSRIKEEFSDRKKRRLPVVRVKKISKIKIRDNQFYDLMTKKNHNYLAGKDCLVFVHNTVLHGFIGERISNIETVKNLVKKIFTKFHLPYFTITPTFSICPHHGYISGEHFTCPKCTIEQPCEVYSRVVGYLRPVGQWNRGKQEEFRERKEFKIKIK